MKRMLVVNVVLAIVAGTSSAAFAASAMQVLSPLSGDTVVNGQEAVVTAVFNNVPSGTNVTIEVIDSSGTSVKSGVVSTNTTTASGARMAWTPAAVGTYNVRLTAASDGTVSNGTAFTVIAAPAGTNTTTTVNVAVPTGVVDFTPPSNVIAGEVFTLEFKYLPLTADVTVNMIALDGSKVPMTAISLGGGYALFTGVFADPGPYGQRKVVISINGVETPVNLVVSAAPPEPAHHAFTIYFDWEQSTRTWMHQPVQELVPNGPDYKNQHQGVRISGVNRKGLAGVQLKYLWNMLAPPDNK